EPPPAGSARRRPRPRDRRRARVGHRPLQLPLPVLHARRGPAVARARRRPLLRGDRAGGRAAGRDGRPRRAPHGRRAPRAQGAVAPRRPPERAPGRPRPLAHHQRLPAREAGRAARGRRPAPRQRLARLARRRPLLRDDPARLARCGARGPRGRRALRGAAPDQGQRGRAQGLHGGRGRRVRRVRPPQAVRGSLHRVHAARRRPRVGRLEGAAQRGRARPHPRRPPARADRPCAERHRPPLPLRRRAGRDRLHLPGDRAVLRGLQPHPPDRRRPPAHLPVLRHGDRPARPPARRRLRRRARADRARRRVAQGAQAPGQRAGIRTPGALHVADRWL
ncbi:MAG: Cyclic pyranopterin phosphate synthase (MoaA), partial [uncultured Solirubrobacteraceae bacterium]